MSTWPNGECSYRAPKERLVMWLVGMGLNDTNIEAIIAWVFEGKRVDA